MAELLANIIDLVHPTVSGIGVITADQIWILFDREIDEDTLAAGNFFVTGPDFDTWSGPDMQFFVDPDDPNAPADLLESPGFAGVVQGQYTCHRIALDSLEEVDTLDTIGSGGLYRTKAIFTPINRLKENTEYRVYISGDEDETDDLQTGLSERTVFDTIASGANTSTGEIVFTGGYTGPSSDTYDACITTSGERGAAKFVFSRLSDPFSIFGPFYTKGSVLLSDGITAEFTDGFYSTNDHWSVIVKPRNIFLGNITWPFKTGTGSIQELPDTISTSVLGAPATPDEISDTTTFEVESTDPTDGTGHLRIIPGPFEITVDFNTDIDAATVLSGIDVSVTSENVAGEVSDSYPEDLITLPLVSGVHLYLVVASGELLQNKLITVTLDESIASTGGTTLDSDYSFSFTTEYSPLYCTVRRLRLSYGAYLENISDDTLNLAIYLASLEANSLTWNTAGQDTDYYLFVRGQWTCCRAAQILLTNTLGTGAGKSKRLGDLQVDYKAQGASNAGPLQQVANCLLKWEGVLLAGGRQVQTPRMVVKGDRDPDRIACGRGWRDDGYGIPAANGRVRVHGSRRIRHQITTRTGWWNR